MTSDFIHFTCSDCRFLGSQDSALVCRFHAPQPGNLRLSVTWPPVDRNDWCGQYQPAFTEGGDIVQPQLPLAQNQSDLVDTAVKDYLVSKKIGALITFRSVSDSVRLVRGIDLVSRTMDGRHCAWKRRITQCIDTYCRVGFLTHTNTKSHYILAKHP